MPRGVGVGRSRGRTADLIQTRGQRPGQCIPARSLFPFIDERCGSLGDPEGGHGAADAETPDRMAPPFLGHQTPYEVLGLANLLPVRVEKFSANGSLARHSRAGLEETLRCKLVATSRQVVDQAPVALKDPFLQPLVAFLDLQVSSPNLNRRRHHGSDEHRRDGTCDRSKKNLHGREYRSGLGPIQGSITRAISTEERATSGEGSSRGTGGLPGRAQAVSRLLPTARRGRVTPVKQMGPRRSNDRPRGDGSQTPTARGRLVARSVPR